MPANAHRNQVVFNNMMMNELSDALYKFDADPAIGCIILAGSVRHGRRYFHGAVGRPARKEGMSACLEKRAPGFEGK